MYACPCLDERRKYIVLWVLLLETKVICGHSLGMLGIKLVSVHSPDQY